MPGGQEPVNRLVLERRVNRTPGSGPSVDIALLVDGRPFVEMAREFEHAFAGELAGAYEGLVPVDAIEDVLLAADAEPGGKTELLGCTCRCPGCWPLAARIIVEGGTVTWSEFEQPHRDWSYAGFGPFVFDLDQYRDAIRGIQDAT